VPVEVNLKTAPLSWSRFVRQDLIGPLWCWTTEICCQNQVLVRKYSSTAHFFLTTDKAFSGTSQSHTHSTISEWRSEDDTYTPETIQKPRTRGYLLDSDDDQSDFDDDETRKKLVLQDLNSIEDNWEDEDGVIHIRPDSPVRMPASLLPSYTEKIDTKTSLSLVERTLCKFTTYKELKDATLDSHYEAVFTRLQQEWTYVGGLVSVVLVAIHMILTSSFISLSRWQRMSFSPQVCFNTKASVFQSRYCCILDVIWPRVTIQC